MGNDDIIILGGSNWTRTELKLFGEKFKSIYVGKYNGTEFPVDKIINYDCVFSPFHFSIATHFPDGVNDEHSSNPYLPKDKDYYVSIVKKDNRYGMIDSNGNIILQICYQIIRCANKRWEPYFIVKKEDCAFMFDVLRKKVISELYDDIKDVAQHFIASRSTDEYFKSYKNGKCGLIHETGKLILPPNFDDCFGLCFDGENRRNPEYRFAIVTLDKKKGLYNELGNEVLPIQYDSLRFSYPEYPESIYAKSIRVLGKIGDERERDLIDYGVKNDNNTKHGRCSTYERTTYERYGGTYAQDEMGYSDDDIDTIFDGDPDAYWNID